MKITMTIRDEVYSKLERDRGLVPRSTWVSELIMRGVQGIPERVEVPVQVLVEDGIGMPEQVLGSIPEPKGPEVGDKMDEFLYEDIIESLKRSFEYEFDYEQREELNGRIKEAGLTWNNFKRRLEKFEEGKYKIIYQF